MFAAPNHSLNQTARGGAGSPSARGPSAEVSSRRSRRPLLARPVADFRIRRSFLLQEQRRFLAQYWKKAFRCLRQEPR